MKREIVRAWAKAKIHGLENINSFFSVVLRQKWIFLAGIIFFLFVFLYWNFAKALMLMAFFIAIGVASMYYMKFIRIPIGLELNMLGTVIIGMLYGAVPAIITGLLTLFIAELITERLTHSTFVSFLGIVLVGVAITLFPDDWTIGTVGIAATLFYDAVIIPLYLLMGSSPARSGVFLVTHIAFNIWVFSFIAPPLYNILT